MLLDNKKQDILGRLVINNQDLDFLESTLSEFNIFEAIGIIRQEIKHSNFLAFLLNPSESHRLSDLFLKKLLICALLNSENASLSPIEVDIADLEDAEIRREWKNIDILIYSPANKLVFAIENKVDSSEHSNQLARYRETVSIEFPECRKIFLYLTKEGHLASDAEWLSLSYREVIGVIESICNQNRSTIGDDVYTLMSHYVSLVKRHLMSNSDIAKLCQKIYKQHRQALDLIYEHRPDLQSEVSEFIQQIIQDSIEAEVERDDSSKQFIRFAPKEWDDLAFQKTCPGWTSSQRVLLFEFVNEPQYLGLDLVIGPSGGELKQAIFKTIKELKIAGLTRSKLKETGWSHIWKQRILDFSDYGDSDLESLQEKIESFWKKYLNNEIKLIRQAIAQLKLDPRP
ncbi:MAG TPA: PD-(D/E)XK nuclease family protein [Trichocoleus sp.]|jgi:hypothetical protein